MSLLLLLLLLLYHFHMLLPAILGLPIGGGCRLRRKYGGSSPAATLGSQATSLIIRSGGGRADAARLVDGVAAGVDGGRLCWVCSSGAIGLLRINL